MADARNNRSELSMADHDLLIRLHTLVLGLVDDMKRLTESSSKKADDVDLVAMNLRVTALEQFRWKAAGVVLAVNTVIAAVAVLLAKLT